MGNPAWLLGVFRSSVSRGDPVLEIGAGTGENALRLRRHGWLVDGLDLWPSPRDWPAGAAWHSADLRTFAGYGAYRAVLGNLIFHQFAAAELAELGERLQAAGCRALIACEPLRRRRFQRLFRVIAPLIGANHVSRHDAHVSISAGFTGEELPQLLGLDRRCWSWRCEATGRGAYHMLAWRRTPPEPRS